MVTEIRDHTYYAELHLSTPTGPKVVSSRPSDAIALAVRFGAPLFASEELLDEVGQVPAPEPEEEQEEIIDEFRDFLENRQPRRLRLDVLTALSRRRRGRLSATLSYGS